MRDFLANVFIIISFILGLIPYYFFFQGQLFIGASILIFIVIAGKIASWNEKIGIIRPVIIAILATVLGYAFRAVF